MSIPDVLMETDLSYQIPHPDILDLADPEMPPYNLVRSAGDYILLLHRNMYKELEELVEPEMRLAGLRINPTLNISSRSNYFKEITILKVGEKEDQPILGLPKEGKFTHFRWSPDEQMLAFTHTTEEHVELWALSIEQAFAWRVSDVPLNANLGVPYVWSVFNEGFILKTIPEDRLPLKNKDAEVPQGPSISVNSGEKAQNRTFQDLLKDKVDEFNFEQLTRSKLVSSDLYGRLTDFAETGMYRTISFSPSGIYLMVLKMTKPFSYLVPYARFPFEVEIYQEDAKFITTFYKSPLIEQLPKGFMSVKKGKRSIGWRSDKESTIYFVQALDEGDAENDVPYRDEVRQLAQPFYKEPELLVKTKNRFAGITWCDDTYAIVYDYWWNTRMLRTSSFNPMNMNQEPMVLFERNYQDKYNDPGNFVTRKNEFHKDVLVKNGGDLYLNGEGHSPKGMRPFIDKLDIYENKFERLWQASGEEELEEISEVIDIEAGLLLTRKQSKSVFPNYYLRTIGKNQSIQQITFNKNPFQILGEVHKEVIKYTRTDGLALSATLYLPVGYPKDKAAQLPMIMWAYPEEHKEKSTASQVTSSQHEFIYPWYGSPIYWVNRGYAILDEVSFPIVGEGDQQPNDTYLPQLIDNAKAAIDAVDALGYIDRKRVAIGGHSYGAFMTANLLTHSDLFAAGIARSGAYNRTLTPFGFQSEERNFWEAPETYQQVSPFRHADKMKYPLLLIHGEDDSNSGTYTMQSERYFSALKALGALVRLVILPKESHGYVARKSILHMLWEQDQWLEHFVKNKHQSSEPEKES